MNELININSTAALTAIDAAEITAELFNRFIAYVNTDSKKTVETYTRALRQFMLYLQANGISKPSRADIIAYNNEMQARGLKPTTRQSYIAAVKVFFKWTKQEGIYPDIAEHLKGAKLDREHKRENLTSSQVKQILGSIDRTTTAGLRDYALFLLTVSGGLRTIELERALYGDIGIAGNSTVLHIQGKGHTEKTEYIIIAPQVEAALRAYIKATGGRSDAEPIFKSTSNNSKGKAISSRTISEILKHIMVNAGFDSDKLTAHSLRHTAITLVLMGNGGNLAEAQAFSRHENIATLMIYNHAIEKGKAKENSTGYISSALFD